MESYGKKGLTHNYKTLINGLEKKLFEHFAFCEECPDNEFSMEAQMILARMHEATSCDQVAGIVREVFGKMFGSTFKDLDPKYGEVAAWLWDEYCKAGFQNH